MGMKSQANVVFDATAIVERLGGGERPAAAARRLVPNDSQSRAGTNGNVFPWSCVRAIKSENIPWHSFQNPINENMAREGVHCQKN